MDQKLVSRSRIAICRRFYVHENAPSANAPESKHSNEYIASQVVAVAVNEPNFRIQKDYFYSSLKCNSALRSTRASRASQRRRRRRRLARGSTNCGVYLGADDASQIRFPSAQRGVGECHGYSGFACAPIRQIIM